jgi:hypothetical protein
MDIKSLTIGEAAQVEKIAGVRLSSINDEDGFPMMMLAGFQFVMNKRTNPEYTLDDALNTPLSDLEAFAADDEDPKELN